MSNGLVLLTASRLTSPACRSYSRQAAARRWFSRVTDSFKNLNYARDDSDEYAKLIDELGQMMKQVSSATLVLPQE